MVADCSLLCHLAHKRSGQNPAVSNNQKQMALMVFVQEKLPSPQKNNKRIQASYRVVEVIIAAKVTISK